MASLPLTSLTPGTYGPFAGGPFQALTYVKADITLANFPTASPGAPINVVEIVIDESPDGVSWRESARAMLSSPISNTTGTFRRPPIFPGGFARVTLNVLQACSIGITPGVE